MSASLFDDLASCKQVSDSTKAMLLKEKFDELATLYEIPLTIESLACAVDSGVYRLARAAIEKAFEKHMSHEKEFQKLLKAPLTHGLEKEVKSKKIDMGRAKELFCKYGVPETKHFITEYEKLKKDAALFKAAAASCVGQAAFGADQEEEKRRSKLAG